MGIIYLLYNIPINLNCNCRNKNKGPRSFNCSNFLSNSGKYNQPTESKVKSGPFNSFRNNAYIAAKLGA